MLKFTEQEAEIKLQSLETLENSIILQVSVADTGIGINGPSKSRCLKVSTRQTVLYVVLMEVLVWVLIYRKIL